MPELFKRLTMLAVAGALLCVAVAGGCGAKDTDGAAPAVSSGAANATNASAPILVAQEPDGAQKEVGTTDEAKATGDASSEKKPAEEAASPNVPAVPVVEVSKGWKTYTSKAGGFSVWLPEKTKAQTTPVDTDKGKIVTHKVFSETRRAAYVINFADYPKAAAKIDPRRVLDGARDGSVKSLSGKLAGEKRITLNGFPGLEFSVRATQSGQAVQLDARLFLVKGRLYQLITVAKQKDRSPQEIGRFFQSFKLAKKT